jgi:hypothetical protein
MKKKVVVLQVVQFQLCSFFSCSITEMCSIEVVSRTHPAFKRTSDLIKGQFHECRQLVAKRWASRHINSSDFLILSTRVSRITRAGERHYEVCGFGVVHSKPESMYMDIVCSSHRQGRALIETAERLAHSNRKPLVTLKALHNVIGWYKNLGYNRTNNDCNPKKDSIGIHVVPKGDPKFGYPMSKCLLKASKEKSTTPTAAPSPKRTTRLSASKRSLR